MSVFILLPANENGGEKKTVTCYPSENKHRTLTKNHFLVVVHHAQSLKEFNHSYKLVLYIQRDKTLDDIERNQAKIGNEMTLWIIEV